MAGPAAMAVLAVYCMSRYRDAVLSFFFLDDFWLLRDVSALGWHNPMDIAQIFRPTHVGFELYRPLTQTGYFALLWSIFGCDPAGYHAVQILAYTGASLLVFAIARRLTGSAQAGLGAGLIYATTPGHAVAVTWIAAFTMTGTALAVFGMVWAWLQIDAPRRRVITCMILQTIALLASEHAVIAPVLLALIGWADGRDERWGRRLRLLAPLIVLVGAYTGLKVAYLTMWPPMGSYVMSANPVDWLTSAGQYALGSIGWLKTRRAANPAATNLVAGIGLVLIGIAAAWRAATTAGPWRLLAVGVGVFLVALLPVLPLKDHFYDYFIGIAAIGVALAAIAACQLLSPRWWRSLALGVGLSLALSDVLTGQRAAREDPIYLLVDGGARTSASWIEAVSDATQPGIRNVAVPRNSVTETVFALGHSERVFPHMPETITIVPTTHEPFRLPGRAIVTTIPDPRRDDFPRLPCWNARWDWLRTLARWHLAARVKSRELPGGARSGSPD